MMVRAGYLLVRARFSLFSLGHLGLVWRGGVVRRLCCRSTSWYALQRVVAGSEREQKGDAEESAPHNVQKLERTISAPSSIQQ